MINRVLNGLPSFGNPFSPKPDRFQTWGYRKMALGVLIVSLEELTWDAADGRSQNDRQEMQQAKDEAGPWFESDSFEAFATMAQLPISNELLRRRCLSEPLVVVQELRAVRQSMDDKRVNEQQREAQAAMAPSNLPANNWLFGDLVGTLADGMRGALERARPTKTATVKQGFLFDEVATAEERVAWASVARETVRHRVSP